MKLILSLLILLTSSLVFGQVPSFKGQSDTTKIYPVNITTPNHQVTKTNSSTVLIETGNTNYLPNAGFEGVVLGWVSYKDAAAATPENGTGGTAISSINFTASSPLRGAKSGLFIKPTTVNSLGEGFSRDFTIDPVDRTKIVDISFDYETSPNYSDGDIRIYIYDVSNSKLIELVDRDLMANANGTYRGFFQASPDSVNFRLIAHVATTKTADFTVKLDEVKVSPQAPRVTGAIKTDWTPYTPIVTHTSGVMTNYSLSNTYWRRDGDSIQVKGKITFTGAVGTFTNVKISLPSGVARNTTVSPNYSNLGEVRFWDAGAGDFGGTIYSDNVSNIYLLPNAVLTHSGTVPVAEVPLTQAFPFTFVSGDSITWQTDLIAVQGWSSNMVLSEDAGNRKILFTAKKASSQALTSLTTNLTLTSVYDSAAIFNGTDTITIPESGDYRATLTILNDTGPSNYVPYINGSLVDGVVAATPSTNVRGVGSVVLEGLKKGDTVTFRSSQTVTTGASGSNFFSFEKLSSPQTIAASETVAVRATQSSGQSIASAANTVITWSSKDFDLNNSLNISTGAYISTASGKYLVQASIMFTNQAWAVGQFADLRVYKNGVFYAALDRIIMDSNVVAYRSLSGSTTIELSKGDVLDIRSSHDKGVSIPLIPNKEYNYLSITRVGN